MPAIPLTKDAVARVDADDLAMLKAIGNWCLSNKGYAVHYCTRHGKRKVLYMHREIMNAPAHLQVDHIDRDRLNNIRANLRFATRSQNQGNKGLSVDNTSNYKGVRWKRGKWEARIGYQNTRIYLGRYADKQDVALAYDAASRWLFKDFAGCNLPDRETPDRIQARVAEFLANAH